MAMAAGTKWLHNLRRLSATKVAAEAVEQGQSRVMDASLTLIRERAKLKRSSGVVESGKGEFSAAQFFRGAQ
ncbi:hypothetical protein ACP70R_009139 [Stipagrostis hirtigluma subsp. patula]